MAPHRAEADAVREMRDLYAWSEVVARGLESEGIDIGSKENSEDGVDENDDIGMRVGRAAQSLCEWLHDGTAEDECHGIMGELGDLSEREVAGGRISEIDDDSLDRSGIIC